MKIIKEFKEFISRGSVMDLAVGIILGTAFTAIVKSLVKDIIMPVIAWIFGAQDFNSLVVVLRAATEGQDNAVLLTYGAFISAIINFILIALVIFFIVKGLNKARSLKKKEEEEAPAAPPAPSAEEVLLTEIRDLLKKDN